MAKIDLSQAIKYAKNKDGYNLNCSQKQSPPLPEWIVKSIERFKEVELPKIDVHRPYRPASPDNAMASILAALDHAQQASYELPEIDTPTCK